MLRAAIGLFLLLVGYTAPAEAYWWWWRPRLPACEEGWVLEKISERFLWANVHTWHNDLAIEHIYQVRETGVRLPGKSLIDRRYCSATATLSNGTRSEVVYLIEAGAGFASVGSRVSWCLPAYDRYRVYEPWCRAIRPAATP